MNSAKRKNDRIELKFIENFMDSPKLCLAIRIHCDVKYNRNTRRYSAEPYRYFGFKDPNRWRPVMHQTAGVGCRRAVFWMYELRPNMLFDKLAKALDKKYRESCVGMLNNSLECVNDYEDLLNRFGVSASVSYHDLQEGLYPVNPECAKIMTDEKLPEDLVELLTFDRDIHRAIGCIGRWRLYILTENSD